MRLMSLLLCGLLALPVAARADGDPGARLERALAALDSVRAEFTQDLVAADGASTEHAAGTLYLKKPGRFRWDYSTPKQLIVCDGQKLWLYDPELEQATVRRVRDSLSQTPAMLLSGEARVRDGFTVRDAGRSAGLDWLSLRTLIELKKLERNARLADALFTFAPPAGVDVIGTGR